MDPENDDLRSTLEEAFDGGNEEGRPATDATESVRTPTETPTDTARQEAVDRGDGRDTRGKFARKAGDAAAAGTPGDATVQPGEPGQVAAPTDPYVKAPASWKPGAREAWAQLPPDVRAEVHRRERESAQVMQETHQSRQVHQYVGQLAQQFAPALQAEGVDVLTATQNLMQLASRLRFGTPPEKALHVAQIIRNYGVDVNALADALDGVARQQAPQQQMLQDPRVDQLLQELNAAKQTRAEQLAEKAVGDVDAFGNDKEFFDDVREEMADMMEVAAKRGIDLSLEQAYERACAIHPDISKVLAARGTTSSNGNQRRSTQQARHAASSVRGTPTNSESTPIADNLRSEIEAAIEQVGGR